MLKVLKAIASSVVVTGIILGLITTVYYGLTLFSSLIAQASQGVQILSVVGAIAFIFFFLVFLTDEASEHAKS